MNCEEQQHSIYYRNAFMNSKIKLFSGAHFSLNEGFFEAEGIPYKFSQHTAGASIFLRELMSGKNIPLCNSLE